ncbi:unnamed protein product [Microthlaspi erraticum]|uniref:Dirigent protein n=1 Tax=Microthlaspi erraticum TaxID=1685480 RepID=A0A6D2HSL9_9BRAS|nr:unnamed protein product [Microthlaspi erraticum]
MYGRHPTAVKVAEAAQTNTSKTYFGSVFVMDDPLTLLPDVSSKRIGYAQGMTVSASQTELGLLMIFHFVFTEGEYNGSTISILGRNLVFSDVREMPVVGGSGAFRFARGYAEGKTHSLDVKTGNAILEYNIHLHLGFRSFRNAGMKEKNSATASTLGRVLATCSKQAKDYGSCVASKVHEVEKDMCLKEFLALKNCMQHTIRGKA